MKIFFLLISLTLCFTSRETHAQTWLAAVKKDGKWGYIDNQGEWVIQPSFDKVMPFSEGLAAANIGYKFDPLDADKCQTGKWGYIDKTGQWAIEPSFESAESFREGFAKVNVGAVFRPYQGISLTGGKWGFINKDGSWFIQPNDTLYTSFSEGLCAFKAPKESKWGYIDKQNQIWIAPAYWQTEEFHDGLAPVMKGSARFQYIDKRNKEAFPSEFKKAIPFSEGLAFVIDAAGKPSFIDTSGKPVFTIDNLQKTENIRLSFSEKLARAPIEKNTLVRYGFINMAGQWVTEPVYELADQFHDGLALVFIDVFYFFIDASGREIFRLPDEVVEDSKTKVIFKGIPHPNIGRFNHGLCRIKQLDQWGFINKTGKTAIKAIFEDALDFSNADATGQVR